MVASGTPLGLFGFSVTCILLNFVNAGISEPSLANLVMSHAIFFGGIAQFAAGMLEFAAGSLFPATAFSSYGAFWISLAAFTWALEGGLYAAPAEIDLALYFLTWGIFTVLIWIITFRLNKALVTVFTLVVALFFLLAIGEYSVAAHKLAGYVGIVCGFVALYTGWAILLNDTWKGEFLPLGAFATPIPVAEKA
eukprot:CAMPEP_0206460454 /NCGR_PEP_ID=MMETSP0324_2-20121206/24761_1 /ASSEMBLY_ACC=CAM_ASM_000836 /TAXON_ID=2866 /ORGANISM="Crypthecodinium cohnii, Strain Seligo" /LENGTH=193 /DNA_ID=CAMNT_0053932159 /DNA_START=74 /DNA_END=655 /DNA_ORIENTATION=-